MDCFNNFSRRVRSKIFQEYVASYLKEEKAQAVLLFLNDDTLANVHIREAKIVGGALVLEFKSEADVQLVSQSLKPLKNCRETAVQTSGGCQENCGLGCSRYAEDGRDVRPDVFTGVDVWAANQRQDGGNENRSGGGVFDSGASWSGAGVEPGVSLIGRSASYYGYDSSRQQRDGYTVAEVHNPVTAGSTSGGSYRQDGNYDCYYQQGRILSGGAELFNLSENERIEADLVADLNMGSSFTGMSDNRDYFSTSEGSYSLTSASGLMANTVANFNTENSSWQSGSFVHWDDESKRNTVIERQSISGSQESGNTTSDLLDEVIGRLSTISGEMARRLAALGGADGAVGGSQ